MFHLSVRDHLHLEHSYRNSTTLVVKRHQKMAMGNFLKINLGAQIHSGMCPWSPNNTGFLLHFVCFFHCDPSQLTADHWSSSLSSYSRPLCSADSQSKENNRKQKHNFRQQLFVRALCARFWEPYNKHRKKPGSPVDSVEVFGGLLSAIMGQIIKRTQRSLISPPKTWLTSLRHYKHKHVKQGLQTSGRDWLTKRIS